MESSVGCLLGLVRFVSAVSSFVRMYLLQICILFNPNAFSPLLAGVARRFHLHWLTTTPKCLSCCYRGSIKSPSASILCELAFSRGVWHFSLQKQGTSVVSKKSQKVNKQLWSHMSFRTWLASLFLYLSSRNHIIDCRRGNWEMTHDQENLWIVNQSEGGEPFSFYCLVVRHTNFDCPVCLLRTEGKCSYLA